MAITRKDQVRTQRRIRRVRGAQKRGNVPRVSVFRSLKHIYCQIIDDKAQKTLMSASSASMKSIKGDKKAMAQAIGKELAARATKEGIVRVILDRGPYRYHGRIKALAEGLREGGLQI